MKIVDMCDSPAELLVATCDRIRRQAGDKLTGRMDWALRNAEDLLGDVIIDTGLATADQIADEDARVRRLKRPKGAPEEAADHE